MFLLFLRGKNCNAIFWRKINLSEIDFEVQKLKDDLKLKEAELETIGHKLEIKNNEFELLRQEMVERSKTKFNEIDALKKQLAEAERNLAKFVEGQNVLKETPR